MRLAAKVDANQEEIVEGLRKAGCSVQTLARVGAGCPDLLVGYHYQNFLMEIKTDGAVQNPTQLQWARTWKGQCEVVRSLEGALAIIKRLP